MACVGTVLQHSHINTELLSYLQIVRESKLHQEQGLTVDAKNFLDEVSLSMDAMVQPPKQQTCRLNKTPS